MEKYKLGDSTPTDDYSYKAKKGLSEMLVREISQRKKEPEWMLEVRLEALRQFEKMPIPEWGANLKEIKWDEIHYYLRSVERPYKTWEEVPDGVRNVFEKIGVPEAEKELLAGVTGQYDSEKIYGSLKKSLAKKGVVFLSMDEGLREYPELVKKYFGTIVPSGDNKLAALNTAVWSGGSFVYVPKGVDVGLPLQAYFRINAENAGQFERTLIVVEEGASATYIEGCSAPAYSSASLHAAVVEVVVKPGAKCRYTTVQNWYKNVYNLVTKRAWVEKNARMEWVDCNLGCLTGDSLIATSYGGVRIDQIRVGNEVFGLDQSKWKLVKKAVVGVAEMGERRVYQIITDDYREIKATDNHPFLLLKKRKGFTIFELGWEKLKKLRVGDLIGVVNQLPDDGEPYEHGYVVNGKRLTNVPVLGKLVDEDLMWFLGAYLGDGCMDYINSKSGERRVTRVNLAIPIGDKAYKKACRVLMKWGVRWSQRGVSIRINSVYLAQLLLHLGLSGTAQTKKIPNWIFKLDRRDKLAFIEGYLDTDGYVREKVSKAGDKCGQLIFASANKLLLEQIKELMIECGLEPRKITTYRKAKKLWKVEKEYISHYMSMNLVPNLEWIRAHKVGERRAVRFVKIREMKPIGKEMTYDIEVQGVHNFVANGIVVHNSKTTMKYPSCILRGERASGTMLSIAVAGSGQQLDAGAKMIHLAPKTTSLIINKSISKDGGRSSYRGMVSIGPKAKGARSKVVCDALILDARSRSDTYPTNRIMNKEVILEHEAYVSKIGEEQLNYLRSRGLTVKQAETMIVRGFLEPVIGELPMEYAVELNRLIKLEMTESVG